MSLLEQSMKSKGIMLFALAVAFIAIYGYANDPAVNGKGMGQYSLGVPLIKVAYDASGNMKLFALASPNGLSKYAAAEGNSIPEGLPMVLGSGEATMMRNERLFSSLGDRIDGLFGMNTSIGGVLEPTDRYVDDLHFISNEQFERMNGDADKVYVKLESPSSPELFFYLGANDALPKKFALAEGGMEEYSVKNINGEKYYPLVLGATEAGIMREEGAFSKTGDTIPGELFGKNAIIVGVLKPTNGPMDMMHFVPLKADEI